jgi:hypothetical protein
MHSRLKASSWAALIAVSLSACSANHRSIHRHTALESESDSIVIVDAKQRAITQQAVRRNADGDEQIRRFCSEPSPDVFSIVAQSLSAGGSFGRSADPKAIEAALNLAHASAESGSTIPRTQTVNLLRELMFRTCERFLSGGYDQMELSVQAVRDQRLMVSILAIEQLTGTVSPTPTILNTGASGGTGIGGPSIEIFSRLRDERSKSRKAASDALAAFDAKFGTSNGTDRECTAARKATPPNADLLKTCKEIEDKKNSTADAAKEADEAYSVVRDAITTGGTSTSAISNAISSGVTNRAEARSIDSVSDSVERIVELNFNDNTETMLFCLRSIRQANELDLIADQKAILISHCMKFLEADIANEASKLRLATEQNEIDIARSRAARAQVTRTNFDVFWDLVASTSDPNKADPVKLSARLDRLMRQAGSQPSSDVQAYRQCFENKTAKDEIRACFDDRVSLQFALIQ